MPKPVSIIGYSGHAFVACEILSAMGREILGYHESKEKKSNPYNLKYLGAEEENLHFNADETRTYFVAIGDNSIRKRITTQLEPHWGNALTIIHPSACVSPTASLGPGSMVSSHATVNAQAKIGKGAICNTGAIIEHECLLGDFVHVAPGATLCGNVQVGAGSLIGANAVVKPGIRIGEQVIIGAGAVIVKSVPDHSIIIGNPQHSI